MNTPNQTGNVTMVTPKPYFNNGRLTIAARCPTCRKAQDIRTPGSQCAHVIGHDRARNVVIFSGKLSQ